MKQTRDITYRYAFDENADLVNIEDVTKQNRIDHTYYCVSCGKEVTAKLGEVKSHHFAHTVHTACDGETYIHKLSKYLVKNKFDNSSSFFIPTEKHITCSKKNECELYHSDLCEGEEYADYYCGRRLASRFNLKNIYDRCSIEKSVGRFVADVLLEDSTGKHRPFMVEICVTHPCEKMKIESGYPILEIPVKTEQEATDISNMDTLDGTLYNWPFEQVEEPLERITDFTSFALFPSGKFRIDSGRLCSEVQKTKYSKALLEFSVDNEVAHFSDSFTKEDGLIYAIDRGYWKIAVEKATAAEWNVPLKKSGDNLKQIYRYFSDLRDTVQNIV